MKINKIILPVVASAMLLTGCDDQIMEWGLQDGHTAVTAADIPSAVKEVLANYDDIKVYSAANHPNMKLGLGVGKDVYMGEDGRHDLAVNNFQMITWGNAMKHDALMKNNGVLDFAALDPALAALQEDAMQLWGHNFVWYQQQNQTYLKSLIAPEFVVESDSDIKNLLGGDSFDFEGGTKGKWKGQGGNNPTVEVSSEGEGYNSKYAIVLDNPTDGGSGNDWKAQCLYEFDLPLEQGKEYTLRFKAKCSVAGGSLQFIMQNADYSNQEGWGNIFNTTTDWAVYEKAITPSKDDLMRIVFNFGSVKATYYIDDIEFGEKVANPDEGRKNLIKNSTFDSDANDWATWNGGDCKSWNETEGNLKAGSMQVVNPSDNAGNQWKVQIHANLLEIIPEGTKFYVSYYIKCASGSGSVRCSTTGKAHYQGDQTVGTSWQRIEWTIDAAGDIEGLNFDLAQVANTYYIDDVVVSTDPFNGSEAASRASRRAKSYYVLKTAEEKQEALTTAMEDFIKGVAEHLDEKGIVPVGYDVINEAIADGNGNEVRGFNNVFGGSTTDDEGVTTYDSAPVENEQDGLSLNWGNNRFYWGYYMPDYAVKAFQFARQYLPAETKLFYNDYNLESSDSKRAAVIKFVQDIDAANGSAIVDGIGTQMHVSFSPTDDTADNAEKIAELRAKVDKQFKELAATGKLIRITELDISVNTGSPSAAQYKAQSDAYQTIFESYFENVPEAQQSGITIWSLTDADDEHVYWLKGQVPNLWDSAFKRKWAYKGVCDALAGEDIGLTFGSEAYKVYYERQNVSDTVK